MNNQNEPLWDGDGEDAGDAFDLKCEEWERRDWMVWLPENLVFPFKATRQEDMDDADFQQGASTRLFQVGHTLEVLGLDGEDEKMGVIVKAKEKGQIGHLPLADLEVKPKTDRNYWPVREYVVWFANR
jgi:hypothetical protein